MSVSVFRKRAAAPVLAAACALLWGTAFPFIKLGYSAFEIAADDRGAMLLFAGLRFSIAGLMALALTLFKKSGSGPIKNLLPAAALLGAVQTFAQYLFTYIGLGLTTAANTSIITACASFLTVLAVPLFFKSDRITAVKLLGCALGFGGVLIVNRGGGVTAETLPGDLLVFISTVCAAAGNIIAKKAGKGRDPLRLTAWQLLIGGALLCMAGLILGGRLNLLNLNGLLILLWLAFVSAAAFSVWTALLKYNPASKISVFILLVPVFGTLLSGLLLGEQVFRAKVFISLALISAGIILVNLSKVGEKHGV